MGAITKYKINVFPMKTTELVYGKWKSSGVHGFMSGALSVNFCWNWDFRLKSIVLSMMVSWQHSKAHVNWDLVVDVP